MKIFVIGGKAKTGKNTFGEYLREELKDYGYKPCVIHITAPLYSFARNYFEWDDKTDEKPREFLQKMGTEIIKEKLGKKTFLLDRLYEDIEILSNFFDVFIIPDARLIEEFESIKKKYKSVVSIKLVRENFDDLLTEEEASHVTETEIDRYDKFDYVVKNTGFKSLKDNALEIVRDQELNGEVL